MRCRRQPISPRVAGCPRASLPSTAREYERTGFQGGLQWYRRGTGELDTAELQLFSGRTIDVPAMFIAGSSDWGIYQRPGAIERMQASACTRMLGCDLLDGAGHWVQQEQAGEGKRTAGAVPAATGRRIVQSRLCPGIRHPGAVPGIRPPPEEGHSVGHDGANRLARVHQIEALVDAFERQHVRDQVVDVDLAFHVPVDDLRHVGTAARAAERGALPDTSGDQLERPRR